MNLADNTAVALKLFEQYNYPSKQYFYSILKQSNFTVSHKEVAEFIKQQFVHQITKRTNKLKRNMFRIVPQFNAMQEWQIDLLQLDTYKTTNSGFQYILVMVDVWSRFAMCRPCKNKSPSTVIQAMDEAMIDNKKADVKMVVHDEGNEFRGEFDVTMSLNKIISFFVKSGTHDTLGIINAFCKTIKNMIFKYFYAKNTTKWVDKLQDFVQIYNNKPHGFFDKKLSPLQALDPQNAWFVLELHTSNTLYNAELEAKQQTKVSNFKVGDLVRIPVKNTTFKRGYQANYSHETYTIKKITKNKAMLNDGQTYRLTSLIVGNVTSNEDANMDEIHQAQVEKRVGKALNKLS